MRLRMTRAERQVQLLRIMYSLHRKAKSQKEFTVAIIARMAGVSTVWVYRCVYDEYQILRAELDGPRRSALDEEQELQQRIVNLESQLHQLKERYKAEIQGDVSSAIRHIEALDDEVRRLREYITWLETRLKDAGLYVEVPADLNHLLLNSNIEQDEVSEIDDVVENKENGHLN